MNDNIYVLVTPARNEEAYIEKTIKSVISQKILPLKWVVVSDGSTDKTDEIVEKYANQYDFIELIRSSEDRINNFGSKVKAFDAGYQILKTMQFDYVGNLDADVSFDSLYFKSLIARFVEKPNLGIGGGVITELQNNRYVTQDISSNSVAGAVQLFRRKCYEDIGGYIPMPYGGIDAAAEILARANGWDVKTFPDYQVLHHRPVSTGKSSPTSTMFYRGISYYQLGYHPLFHLISAISKINNKPYVIGSLSRVIGFLWAYLTRCERKIPDSAIKFLRHEQISRLKIFNIL